MTTQEKLNWLRLARSSNIGNATFFHLIKNFGSATEALKWLADYSQSRDPKRKISICSEKEAEEELINTEKFGAEIIIFSDEKYPRLLREIHDPAPVLTLKGKHNLLNKNSVAVVGPRNASLNAITFAQKISSDLGKRSFVVTSGMARGVDSAAHKASITTGTIAVIAGGINYIYPKENAKLYEEIAEHGLVIAENSYGLNPQPYSFIQRNRIISGLSLATIVVEASLKSGSLTTARFAAEQGREVFATPGSPLDPRCHGTNRLIKDGAKMIENIDDVLEELHGIKNNFSKVGSSKKLALSTFELDNEFEESSGELRVAEEEYLEEDEKILSLLSSTPITIEEVVEKSQMPTTLVNSTLMRLELDDKIEFKLGKVVRKFSP